MPLPSVSHIFGLGLYVDDVDYATQKTVCTMFVASADASKQISSARRDIFAEG